MSASRTDSIVNLITAVFLVYSHWIFLRLTFYLVVNYSFVKLWSIKGDYFIHLYQWIGQLSFLFAFHMYYFIYKRFSNEKDYINCLPPSTSSRLPSPKSRRSPRNQLLFAGFVLLASQLQFGIQIISAQRGFTLLAYAFNVGSSLLHSLFMIAYNLECLAFISLISGLNSYIREIKDEQLIPSVELLMTIKAYYDHIIEGIESLDKKFCFIISGYLLTLTLGLAITAEYTVDFVTKRKGPLLLGLCVLFSAIYVLTFLVKCASDVGSEVKKTSEYFKDYLNSIAAKEQIGEDFRVKYRELKDCGFLKQKASLTIFGFYKIRDSLVLNLLFNLPSLYTLFTCLKPRGKP